MPNIKEYSAPQIGVGGVGGVSGSIGGVQNLRPNDAGLQAMEQAARTQGRFAAQESDQLASVGRGMVRTAEAKATALRDVARGVEDLGNAVGYQVAKHQEQQEVTKFYSDYAKLSNSLTRAWMDTRAKSDLNDPGVADKFNEEVLGPALTDFSSGFQTAKGRELAQAETGRLAEHMFVSQKADMSTAAGEAAVQNVTTFANLSADTLHTDPSAYDFTQDSTRSLIANLAANPNLTAEGQAHLKTLEQTTLTNNTKAALIGMADKNPDRAMAELDAGFGKEHLSVQDRAAMQSHIQSIQRMHEERDRAGEVRQRQVNGDAANAAANNLLAAHIKPDGTLVADPNWYIGVQQLASMPNAPDGLARAMYDMGVSARKRSEEKAVVTTDPDLFNKFAERALLPDNNPERLTLTQIFDANARNLLDDKDMARLREYVSTEDPQKKAALSEFQTVLSSFKETVAPSRLGLPPTAQSLQKWGQLQVAARDAFESAYTKGNWRSAIKAGTGDYIFNDVGRYTQSSKENMKDYIGNVRSGVPDAPAVPDATKSRQPGESIDDFLKRSGG